MKILVEKAVIEQALEALELFGTDDMAYIKSEKAITALREALDPELQFVRDWNDGKVRRVSDGKVMGFAEQAEQEPVIGYDITQREDGEGFVVPTDEVYGLVCCDCGLVHDVVWSYDKDTNELGMAAKRNDKATEQRRRAEQAEQEPVAWGCRFQDGSIHDCICPESHAECEGDYNIPLYAAPVMTKDLTDDEIRTLLCEHRYYEGDLRLQAFARAVIVADREKNK